MGYTTTPKYRISYTDQQGTHTAAWNCRESGKPTTESIAKYAQAMFDSMKIGGCNQHISKMLGYIPAIHKAEIIRQTTGNIVATWEAAMFQVF